MAPAHCVGGFVSLCSNRILPLTLKNRTKTSKAAPKVALFVFCKRFRIFVERTIFATDEKVIFINLTHSFYDNV